MHRTVNSSSTLDRRFAALAHPVRRAIVEQLARGPATVGAATAGLDVTKPAVTKHLRVLEEADLVARDVRGRTHVLRLQPAALDDAAAWIERQRELWESLFAAIDRHLEDQR